MPLANEPNLMRRIENAVIVLIGAITALNGVAKRAGVDDDTVATPYITVNANRQGEVIHNSGVQEVALTIHLKTTIGNGTKATDDEAFLAYDAAIESVIWGGSTRALAAAITGAGEYLQIYAVRNPASQPAAFDDARREIIYTLTLHAIAAAS